MKSESSWRATKPGYQHQKSWRSRSFPHKCQSSWTVRTHLQGDIGPGQGPAFSVAPPYQPDKSDCGPSIAAITWLGSAARLTSVGYDFVVSI